MIKLKSLHLENFRGFTETEIEFSDHITCIAGINGAGKTSCLDALSYSLSWVTEMLKLPPYKNGRYVNPEEKKKGAVFATKIDTCIIVDNSESTISVGADFDPGIKIQFADQPTMRDLFNKIKNSYPLEKRTSIPVIAYYPSKRSELNIDTAMDAEKDLSDKYEVYADNLTSVIHYKSFFQWFRDREDRENEEIITRYKKKENGSVYEDVALKAVRKAISMLLPNFSQMTVDRKKQTVLIKKEGSELDFSLLSEGEKEVITLFGDIARRLAIANETLEAPLEGNGIILIDEIELHLHPSWQRKICRALKEAFPNCQFIITTHSPQVLGELQPEEIRLLNNFKISIPSQSYGLDSNSILDSIQNTTNEPLRQNSEVAKRIERINNLIDEEKLHEAREKLSELEKDLNGSTVDTVALGTEIALMEDAE